MHLILLVDDDDDLAATLADGLTGEGYAVDRRGHGREALDALRTGPRPSAVLLDLMMPVMDGWTLCDALATQPSLQDIPVVVMTASGPGGPAPVHARSVIRKPFSWDALLAALAAVGALPAARPWTP